MARSISIDAQAEFLDAHGAAYLVTLSLSGVSYRYTTWRLPLTVDGNDYSPRGIAFGGAGNDMSIGLDRNQVELDNVDLSIGSIMADPSVDRGSTRITLDLFLPDTGDRVNLVRGSVRLESVNLQVAVLDVTPDMSPTKTVLPLRDLGELCQWRFGDSDTCAFTIAGIKDEQTGTVGVGSTSGQVLDVSRDEDATYTGPGTYWSDGFVTITSGAMTGEIRRVTESADGSFTLEIPLPSAPATGAGYSIVRGCDRTFRVCDGRFANTGQFGGFVNFPRLRQ